ncbi:MAG TPA: MmcQ/YjbR family DNA-binding protein [Caulobacteraceae bacterium]|jgi:hypothetical protein
MSDFERLRQTALRLPGAVEGVHRGEPAFYVAGKTFALWWQGRTIMKLERGHQALLFEVRPEIFQPCTVGRIWSFVDLGALDDGEVDALTREAWATVASARLRKSLAP